MSDDPELSSGIDNGDDFANAVIDSTLDALKSQEDDSQDANYHGKADILVGVFGPDVTSFVQGPIHFPNTFNSPPHMSFGQMPDMVSGTPAVTGTTALSYTPLLFEPYVFQWSFTNGQVDGFYLGLYAKTDIPAGVIHHTIFWKATGKASQYQDTTSEAWTEAYDYNDAEYLVDDVDTE